MSPGSPGKVGRRREATGILIITVELGMGDDARMVRSTLPMVRLGWRVRVAALVAGDVSGVKEVNHWRTSSKTVFCELGFCFFWGGQDMVERGSEGRRALLGEGL